MKILQVCPGAYQPGRGGVSEHVRNISERLAKTHDVVVYATNPDNALPRRETVNGVKIERFRRLDPSRSYFFSAEMMLNLRRSEFDVVHGHSYHAFPMHSTYLAKRRKLIVSTHFHGFGHSTFRNCLFKLFKPIGRMTLLQADKIVAVSTFEKSLLCRYFRLDSSRVVVIPNGLDFTEFANLEHHKRDSNVRVRHILYVGRLESYKGIEYLIDVLPMLKNDLILEVIGEGPLRRTLENKAKYLGASDRVLFSRDLSRRELLQKYADADLFVLLSEHEAYSLVVAEALTAGTPCIVADTSALSEWIDNKTCFGIGVPVKLSNLAKLIEETLNSKISDVGTGKWIGTKILSWDEVVKRLEEIYNCSS